MHATVPAGSAVNAPGLDALDLPRTRQGGRMKLAFLQLPAEERRLCIEEATTRRNVSLVVSEKNFWVGPQKAIDR
jgi:hypothetical protein